MEQIPTILSQADNSNRLPPTPGGEAPLIMKNQSVTIKVARTENAILDHLIVTFAKVGPLTCQDLLTSKTSSQLLLRAESEGVSLHEPALLATVDDNGVARTIFITPVPQNSFRDFAVWVGQVSETVNNLKAEQVGLYLCKDSLSTHDLVELVSQTVRALVEYKTASDICLVVGKHSYNDILRLALQLKQELDGANASVHVLH